MGKEMKSRGAPHRPHRCRPSLKEATDKEELRNQSSLYKGKKGLTYTHTHLHTHTHTENLKGSGPVCFFFFFFVFPFDFTVWNNSWCRCTGGSPCASAREGRGGLGW